MPHTDTPWSVMLTDEWMAMPGHEKPSSVFHIGDYTIVTETPSYEFHASDKDDAEWIVMLANKALSE